MQEDSVEVEGISLSAAIDCMQKYGALTSVILGVIRKKRLILVAGFY